MSSDLESHLLDTLLETMAALVVVFDTQGRVVLFNQACQDLTGFEVQEVLGNPIWDLLIPDDQRSGVIATFKELQAGAFPNRYENDWLTKTGEWRRLDWSNSVLLDDDGQVQYVVGTGVDITERRAAEARQRELIRQQAASQAAEAVRDSARLADDVFSGIVDLSADAIITIDDDQTIQLFNQGAEEIFGYTPDEVLGRPLDLLLPEDARPTHAANVEAFGTSHKPSRRMGERGQIYGRRKGGELFPAEASISKQRLQGQWLFTAVVRDVTEEQQARKRLKQANTELSRSNQELEHFAAVASHDLQEPLRKIQAFGERLESKYSDLLPARGQDYLRRMQNAAGRMSHLINDLLAFSRVTTRARPFTTVDLNDVVDDVLSDLVVRIEDSRAQVTIAPLLTVDADPLQMHLLFLNLLGNALKFHRPDVPPVVDVGLELLDDDYCTVFVQDNGAGFDEKYLDRIFDVFQRLHGRGVYEGTGMGLAIARKIVDRHGGHLTAKSSPGEGARFLITLPIAQDHRPDEDP